MNKKALILSIPMMLAVLLLGGWFLFREPQKIPESQNPPQKPEDIKPSANIDTSNWKTYRNEEYGFELKYPDSWSSSEAVAEYNSSISLVSTGGDGGKYFCLDIDLVSLGSSWLYRMSDSDRKRIVQKDSLKTIASQDVSLLYFGDGTIGNTIVSSVIPLEVPPKYEAHISASFNCVQADNELLTNPNEKMSESPEFKTAVDIIKTIRSVE